jgi:hypothetical protein
MGRNTWSIFTKRCVNQSKYSPHGQPIWMRLVYAGETKIRRHVKVRRDANPFDPQWKSYFVERAFHKKFGTHRHEAGVKPSCHRLRSRGAL